jgi:hypothetical protein
VYASGTDQNDQNDPADHFREKGTPSEDPPDLQPAVKSHALIASEEPNISPVLESPHDTWDLPAKSATKKYSGKSKKVKKQSYHSWGNDDNAVESEASGIDKNFGFDCPQTQSAFDFSFPKFK